MIGSGPEDGRAKGANGGVPPSRLHRAMALAAVAALYFILMAGSFNALGVVLPSMVSTLGLNWSEAGLGFTLLGLSCGLTSLVPAALIRRVGIVATLFIAGVVLANGFALLAAASGLTSFYFGTLMIGCGFTIGGSVPGTYVVANLFARPGRPMGLYFGVGGLGSIAGPLLYLGMHHLFGGWRPFWWFCAVAAGLCGVVAALATRGLQLSQTHDDAIRAFDWSARALFRRPAYWVIVATYTGCLAINTTLHGFAVQHLTEGGVSPVQAAELMSVVALIAACCALGGGEGERLIGPRGVTALASLLLGAAALALTLPQHGWTLGVFCAAMGGGIGLSYVGSAVLLIACFGRRHHLELYSMMCLISTAAALGPWLGGLLHDATGNFRLIFMGLAAIGIILSAAIGMIPRVRSNG